MVSFILDTLLDTFLDTFFGQIFCALTLTTSDNLHQYSWFDNCVITNIEVANIVCDMQKLLTLWWLMHCGKLAVTVWFVDKHLTSWFSVWCGKLRVTVWFVNRHLTFCVSSTDILCDVESLRLCVIRQQTFCVLWKTYLQNTFRKHDINIIVYHVKLCLIH